MKQGPKKAIIVWLPLVLVFLFLTVSIVGARFPNGRPWWALVLAIVLLVTAMAEFVMEWRRK